MSEGDPTAPSHSVVEYDAIQNPVKSVTVFQRDRAEVNRRIKVDLNEGQNDVEVRNLPTCLLEDSIRVDGIGDATIFDVVYYPTTNLDYSQDDGESAESKAQQQKIKSQLEIYREQADILKEYSNTLRACDTDSSRLEEFLDIYATRKAKIDDATTALNERLSVLANETITRRKTTLLGEGHLRRRRTRVTIVVLAESKGPVELSLTYVVSNASWTPQYDLRASVASDSEGQSAVQLHYRASISQQTGEDWTGVELTLSTASPLQGTNVPSLIPYWIGEKAKGPEVEWGPPTSWTVEDSSSESRTAFRSAIRRRRGAGVQNALGAPAPVQPPGFFRSRDSEATAGAVSTVFTIPGLSTIPSDSDSAQQTHKVSIAELQYDSVDLEWIAVPKEIPSVFLQCRVKNTSKYVLLPGGANVFLNGSFVAKTSIPHVSPQEGFPCSLGVDPAIRVTYHPRTTKSRTSGNGILSAKIDCTVSEQKITVKNTRLTNIPKLLVREQVPVSRDAKIKVAVLEPNGLKKGEENMLREGIYIRWANWKAIESGDLSGQASNNMNMETAQGILEWICNIQPSASVDLTFAWEISAPGGIEWAQV